ncbi:cell division protein FtsQ/DivIB [Solimonas sp. K1W22B-7]|uniref:cell division protein FtsQ/DivIB n=1 Tax=Solimonas sp. K1W22B-7 TaxID=2303331 RepID=UPI0013C522A3|nr:cell division protein FtsQ/DivIB [Solimonas sp. K1W22B-7]
MSDLRMPAINLKPFLLGLLGMVAVGCCGLLLLRATSSPDVAELEILGSFDRVAAADIEAALRPELDRGFLALPLAGARDRLAALPWVSRSRVERIWPGTLRVRIWEREPFARWNQDDLVDTESRVFTPKAEEIPGKLPLLGGIPGHEREVMETYQRLQERLRETPFALSALNQDARGEWTARTRDGIELRLGRGTPDEKLDMLLGAVLRKLAEELPQVGHIDLRYTNGFAVGWRSQPQPQPQPNNAVGGSEKNG